MRSFAVSVKIQQFDYDSDNSLVQALQGQDALISMVSMSAISHQPRCCELREL
jgi:hypothetical protein